MAITLHRCRNIWVKVSGHPCWNVQKALDDMGIEYVIAKEPVRRSRRSELEQQSGYTMLPVIEFEDGTFYREESKDMAQTIREGRLGTTASSG